MELYFECRINKNFFGLFFRHNVFLIGSKSYHKKKAIHKKYRMCQKDHPTQSLIVTYNTITFIIMIFAFSVPITAINVEPLSTYLYGNYSCVCIYC